MLNSNRPDMQQYQIEVKSLKVNYEMKRAPLSVTIQELISFCNQGVETDYFLSPHEGNPFRGKRAKFCGIF